MAENYPLLARERVQGFFNDFRNDGVPELPLEEVYIVWFTKVLKNWKALVSTTIPDGLYYEITFNGETGETYIDVYSKLYNVSVGAPETEVEANQTWLEFDNVAQASEPIESGIAFNEGVNPETD